jgi:hypothetical protein
MIPIFKGGQGRGYALSVWMDTHNVSNKYQSTVARVIRATGIYHILIENDSHYHNIYFHVLVAK